MSTPSDIHWRDARQINMQDYDDACSIVSWCGGAALGEDYAPFVVSIPGPDGLQYAQDGDWVEIASDGSFCVVPGSSRNVCLTAEHGKRRPFQCVQCEDSGACNGGPCVLRPETSISACITCRGGIAWIDCPTGGWWAHEAHPEDGHDAEPVRGECSAGLLSANNEAVERCVVHDRHQTHRTALGEGWTSSEEK